MSPSFAGIVAKAAPLTLTTSARNATISAGDGRRRGMAVLSSSPPTLALRGARGKPDGDVARAVPDARYGAQMAPLEFAADDVLILFDGGVVETFQTGYDRSFRTPAAWLGVQVTPRKHDRVQFKIGRAKDFAGPVYAPGLELSWTDVVVEPDAGAEPGMR